MFALFVGAFLIFLYQILYKLGPIFLFFALLLGILGFPIPDEILLIASGYLAAHQKLNIVTTVIFAILGSMGGITLSYLMGRLIGHWIIKNYGKTFNLTEDKIKIAKSWFRRIGKWVLVFGYYIPFFRHLVGFVAGGTKLNYKDFALFAYSGALLWSCTFIAIGYFFPDWFSDLFGKIEILYNLHK